jgi:MFS family permease
LPLNPSASSIGIVAFRRFEIVDQSPADPAQPPDGSVSTADDRVVEDRAESGPRAMVIERARFAWSAGLVFLLLFVMHLLDSVDRWLLAAVLPQMSEELRLDSSQAGWLSTALLLGFAVACPVVGILADRVSRPRLLALGLTTWSLATVATGLATNYEQLQAARVLTGAGGAAFTVIALTLLFDLFPRGWRGRAIAAYFLAMPLGAALGIGPVASMARAVSWQTASLIVGAPGFVLAMVALALPNPVRGQSEEVSEPRLRLHERVGPNREDYIDLMVNSSFNYSLFGMAFSSFALAGMAYWLPPFLALVKGLTAPGFDRPLAQAVFGAAILGTILGGWLADWFSGSRPAALFAIPAAVTFGAIVAIVAVIYGRPPAVLAGIFTAVLSVFLNMAPCYTISAGVVMPNMRGVGCGVALAVGHLFGDLWSPAIMGWVIETFGQSDSMATGFGQAFAALGAVPIVRAGGDPENLTAGLLVLIPALLISGVVLVSGARHLDREMKLMLAKLRAMPSRGYRPASVGKRAG